ncbi:hypothetical protein EMWEY_00059390 [Eimeria maxima]|uniref:Uncharacterized protein n=1 Tax=Eimeria maxima TaxID=5804 RepID=U6M7C0_EIMMA|nr:hypothetical protein EMWEY_00059390 [Eimeria maxima]CDJ59936.1 hypothetical protein EMWEY_00059390 [Eimeria maxima]
MVGYKTRWGDMRFCLGVFVYDIAAEVRLCGIVACLVDVLTELRVAAGEEVQGAGSVWGALSWLSVACGTRCREFDEMAGEVLLEMSNVCAKWGKVRGGGCWRNVCYKATCWMGLCIIMRNARQWMLLVGGMFVTELRVGRCCVSPCGAVGLFVFWVVWLNGGCFSVEVGNGGWGAGVGAGPVARRQWKGSLLCCIGYGVTQVAD